MIHAGRGGYFRKKNESKRKEESILFSSPLQMTQLDISNTSFVFASRQKSSISTLKPKSQLERSYLNRADKHYNWLLSPEASQISCEVYSFSLLLEFSNHVLCL